MTDHPRNQRKRKADDRANDSASFGKGIVTAEVFASTVDRSNDLCPRCETIDLGKVSQLEVKNNLGTYIANLEAKEALDESLCPFCKLLGRVCPPSASDNALHLRAFSANSAFTRFNPKDLTSVGGDNILLGITQVPVGEANSGRNEAATRMRRSLEETGYLLPTRQDKDSRSFSVRLLSPSFDLDIARHWLRICHERHGPVCGRLDTTGCLARKRQQATLAIRVIDCETRKIIRAPGDCAYVALSYVWGAALPENGEDIMPVSNDHLPTLPKTIEDSIQLTKGLGLRYLWVDRYCIDQTDKDDKHRQIQQMDQIYSFAKLTLIAAAGEGPWHGLPGVNSTPRHRQESLRVKNYLVAETLPHASWSLNNSRWAERGWTYQEGILSNCRLIFTPTQVLFECNSMHCSESLILPLELMHTRNKKKGVYRKEVPVGSFSIKLAGNNSWDITRYIAEFYERKLSYPEDTLNAIQGVFRVFERMIVPTRFFAGIPIHAAYIKNPGTGRPMEIEISAKDSFINSLDWVHLEPGQRNVHFPSWSWAGWTGGKLRPATDKIGGSIFQFANISFQYLPVAISIEEPDGSLTKFPEEMRALAGYLYTRKLGPRYLHFEIWTVPCSLTHTTSSKKSSGPSGIYAKIPLNETDFGFKSVQMSQNLYHENFLTSGLTRRSYTALLFARQHDHTDPYGLSSTCVIVVEDCGGHHERVGWFEICVWSDIFHAGTGVLVDRVYRGSWFENAPKVRKTIRMG